MNNIRDIQSGQSVAISNCRGEIVAIGICKYVLRKQAYIKSGIYSGNYSLATGIMIGTANNKPITASVVMEIEAARIEVELESKQQRERDEQARLKAKREQAAYEALPEAIKLSRSLRWLCDCESEAKIAEAPIEHLRGIIAWAKRNKLTTE